MKKRVFFLNDIQDFWLFNSLIRFGDEIVYNSTSKITSPHHTIDSLKPNFKLTDWLEMGKNYVDALIDCDAFITKECHPFTSLDVDLKVRASPSPLKDKTYSISWVGESAATNFNEDCRNNVENKFKYHFVQPSLVPLYTSIGLTEGIIPSNPKYYFLNTLDRKKACQMLGLDHQKKYATILVTQAHQPASNEIKILDHIIQYCNRNDIGIIFKTKVKYHNFYRENIKHEYFFSGNKWEYHQTLVLMMVSNFVLGFSTSASLEAECMGVPFISFWRTEKHDKVFDVNCQDIEFFHENFDKAVRLANKNLSYRIPQSDKTFVVKKSEEHEYNKIKDKLDVFLHSTQELVKVPKFDVHPYWKEIY